MKKVLITGAAGFIGANFVQHLLARDEEIKIFVLDKLSYAGDLARLKSCKKDKRFTFVLGDICSKKAVGDIFKKGIDTVIHFAAESHVDNSIKNPYPFETSNVKGTLTLLDAARKFGVEKFVHISTDEVYGELGEKGQFFETTPINPNSPYSASKAAGDLFVQAYHHTYKLPVVTVRPSNNYGPWQYPEKLIPVVIHKALANQPVPVYAKGLNVREWLYVEDCAEGVLAVLGKGRPGEAYNVGSGQEKRNIQVVKRILALLKKPESLITFVGDRPGHDFRYSLNADKAKKELGWKARIGFDDGIERTVRWYVDNQKWWRQFVK